VPSLARSPAQPGEHGTRAGYRGGCRCEPCRRADREYARRRYRLKAYGQWQPFTDAAPVREHVRRLMSLGIGAARVGDLAKVPHSSVGRLLYGRPGHGEPPSRRVRTAAAQRLLAVRFSEASLAPGVAVDAAGTRRRLRALVAVGWSGRALAARLAMEPAHLSRILRDRPTVSGATARRVRELYDELWDQPPPQSTRGERISAAKSRAHAVRRGWPPPLAWDDDTIEQPEASPQPWRRPSGGRSLDLAAEAAELAAWGYTRSQAAERIGVSRNTLDKAISRAARRERAA
jgi:transcriptional regulator with XRE-family HTH domain